MESVYMYGTSIQYPFSIIVTICTTSSIESSKASPHYASHIHFSQQLHSLLLPRAAASNGLVAQLVQGYPSALCIPYQGLQVISLIM